MRNLIAGLFIILFSNGFAQHYKPFSKKEISLIQKDSSELMHVSQLKNAEDSMILKTVSQPINPNVELTKLLAGRMLKSVNDPLNQGVGIAAPQVGINRRMILVQRFDKPGNPFEAMINPEILWHSGLMQKGPEGDLSFDERGFVMRHYAVQVQYFNLNGEKITEILEGFTSVIFQHERDHLDGILLTDRLKEQQNLNYEKSENSTDLYFLKN
jgi:peptide deformylase